MKVPFLALSQEHNNYIDDFTKVFNNTLLASDFIQGELVKCFEDNVSSVFQSNYVQSCANGTDAILLSLMASGLKNGDEVLIPSFTYAATAGPVVMLGLKPVFVEVNYHTFTIDIQDLKNKITEKSKAIIPVHLFGQACDMAEIMKIAKEFNLIIIEDNAQSLGTEWIDEEREKHFTGTIGAFGTNSFFPSKNLGGFGDGGAVFCKNEEDYKSLKSIAAHGQNGKYNHQRLGINSRLDTLQAGLLQIKLKYFDDSLQVRKNNALKYRDNLKDCLGIELPFVPKYSGHSYNQFTLKVKAEKRDALQMFLKENEIDAMVYYPKALHQQKAFIAFKNDCPISDKLSREVLSIPIHGGLKAEQLDYVSDKIRQFFK